MVWNTKSSRLRRIEARMGPAGAATVDEAKAQRLALVADVLKAEQKVLAIYEGWAALPYEKRGLQEAPEACRRARWSDAAMVERLKGQRARIAALEAELAQEGAE